MQAASALDLDVQIEKGRQRFDSIRSLW